MTDVSYEDRTRAPDNGTVRKATEAVKDSAGTALGDAAGTAKEQAKQVTGEAKTQVRNLAREVRDRAKTGARSQNDRLADSVRTFADELDEMAGQRGDSPASQVVTQLSQGGRRFADYLAENGPEGVLEGVSDFARRRPGTFLAVAAAAGFVAGRLGKGVLKADDHDDDVTTSANRLSTGYADTGYQQTYSDSAYTEPYATTGYADDVSQAPTQRLTGTTYAGQTGAAVPTPGVAGTVTPSATVVETVTVVPDPDPAYGTGTGTADSDLRNVRP